MNGIKYIIISVAIMLALVSCAVAQLSGFESTPNNQGTQSNQGIQSSQTVATNQGAQSGTQAEDLYTSTPPANPSSIQAEGQVVSSSSECPPGAFCAIYSAPPTQCQISSYSVRTGNIDSNPTQFRPIGTWTVMRLYACVSGTMTFHDRYSTGDEQTIMQQVTAGNAYRAYFQEDGRANQLGNTDQVLWFDIVDPTGARTTSNVITFKLSGPTVV